jgi:uncharacterized protein (DUF1501 family)
MTSNRRTFLKLLGAAAGVGATAHLPILKALAETPQGKDEFFVFVHAAGGWDVTLWGDPRNERKGLVEPASTDNTDTSRLRLWTNAPLDGDTQTFALVRPSGANMAFGPGIGNMANLYDRLTIVNGLEMNTVSHPDGTAFVATGRHLAGGRPVGSSIDTLITNELGLDQLFPSVSIQFPSSFIGNLDARALPLRIGAIDNVAKSLSRSTRYDTAAQRDAVTALLSDEAKDLAKISYHPETMEGLSLQFESLRKMLKESLADVFTASKLTAAHPELYPKDGDGKPVRLKYQASAAVNAAFALEAMKRNLVRSVSFTLNGFDTHNGNYRFHGETQQEAFDVLAAMVQAMDATPHPTLTGERLSDHTHILVVSDFCRTPQINLAGGRDHYPNGSALIVSPRFVANKVLGSSDPEQLLPNDAGTFADGTRPIAPPDVLATFLSAFGIDPRKYLRDGDVIGGALKA